MTNEKHLLMARMEIASEIVEWVADQGRDDDVQSILVGSKNTGPIVSVHVNPSLFDDLAAQFWLDDQTSKPQFDGLWRQAKGLLAGVEVRVVTTEPALAVSSC